MGDSSEHEFRKVSDALSRPVARERLKRYVIERQAISTELLAHHHGKDAGWVRTRLNRIDFLTKEIHILEARLK